MKWLILVATACSDRPLQLPEVPRMEVADLAHPVTDLAASCHGGGESCVIDGCPCTASACCSGYCDPTTFTCVPIAAQVPDLAASCHGGGEGCLSDGCPCTASAYCCSLSCDPTTFTCVPIVVQLPDLAAPLPDMTICLGGGAGSACLGNWDCCGGLVCVLTPGSTQGFCQ